MMGEVLSRRGFKENPKIRIWKLKQALRKVPGRVYKDDKNIIIYNIELEWKKKLTILKSSSGDSGKKTIPDKGKTLIEEIAVKSARMGRVPDVIDLIQTKRPLDEKERIKFDPSNNRYAYKETVVRKIFLKEATNLNRDKYAGMTFLGIGRELDKESVATPGQANGEK
ncbi:hypothetical protein KJ980_08890 [Patescibacteria group bacterium]|nr:hypothetical protein [Patescibacteria group bacterium]MBU4099732.1 hypothetical protein [Patescibacteria group bacterium]